MVPLQTIATSELVLVRRSRQCCVARAVLETMAPIQPVQAEGSFQLGELNFKEGHVGKIRLD